jgi:hypothetical protein
MGSSRPTQREIAETNDAMLRRQQQFRLAAEYAARAFARIPGVERVALFGSVALPLPSEVPRFREYRRAGVAVLHECKDVDIAVWVADLSSIAELRRARSQCVNDLLRETGVGVAHHQLDVFLVESGSDRYLGRLCTFGACPKGKPECLVPGCGATPFLRQHGDFVLKLDALAPDRIIPLDGQAPNPRS